MEKPPILKDDDNPRYLFHCTNNSLLCAIVKGEIDAKDLAKKELENRGLDNNAKWIGFKTKPKS
jgi:hypothetical protein